MRAPGAEAIALEAGFDGADRERLIRDIDAEDSIYKFNVEVCEGCC
jgi:hypothetical protein